MKPHKHAELIKAWADGAKIQVRFMNHDWDVFDGIWTEKPEYTFRIKPEPKPDANHYVLVESDRWGILDIKYNAHGNLKLIIDGETGKLKSAEVLK